MIRTVRALPVLLLIPALLAGCGTEKSGADPAELSSRAEALGIAPELVYTTEAPGYSLAQQSVGVYGDDGFSAVYFSQKNGAQLQLAVDRGSMTADTCPQEPVAGSSETAVVCTRDGDAYYRSAGERSEYAVPKNGFVIRISGEGVPRDVLRQAARNAHRPSADELDALLPSAPAAGEPVERGDLPSTGDGAPDNNVGAGG
ncbi:hypothetical protein OG562_33210 [Streptomyces sp. NBC_01275]|uniref:hypothetical protein n=1 Tax=Streptomyces sp. NBC_01275 TaxID=2903807 RepID=UPI00225C4008|nr:hypothetical protein [Streptomyces sp. NBC_01275]MCX4765753.1 hypothetical protein [Streptomyces sp. NBC_01275]